MLILHDSAAFKPKKPLLSRVDRQGARLWTQPVESMRTGAYAKQRRRPEPIGAKLIGEDLVVLLSETGHLTSKRHLEVALLDPKTGQVRQRHALIPE